MNHLPDLAGVVLLPNRPAHAMGDRFSVRSVDLSATLGSGLPVFVFDEFRVRGHPFGPHPHAGFSVITYVLESSTGGLRSRDSLGHDIRVGPGGMVSTQAGRGVLHEEALATPGQELHGLQVFVNLPAELKLTPPQVLHLDGPQVPQWQGPQGDRVRVVVGSYREQVSPLQPLQGFRWLDVDLRIALEVSLPAGHRMLAYVLEGGLRLQRGDQPLELPASRAMAINGTGAPVQLQALNGVPCRLVLLSGPAVHGPMVGNGPFMMSDAAQLQDAMRRYQAGQMGQLAPALG